MYCINCGVEMADGEKQCPICRTKVCHPDFIDLPKKNLYPENKYPEGEGGSKAWAVLLTVAFILPIVIVTLCDLQFNGNVSWSGYVSGSIVVGYVIAVLPLWFRKPNAVIFVPCSFAAMALFMYYINEITGGNWFLKFALPVTGGVCLTVTAVVALVKYLKKGRLFIFGGAFIFFGGFMLLVEFLMTAVFESVRFVGWSFHPLSAFVIIGGFLVFLGICRPARELMERKFFV